MTTHRRLNTIADLMNDLSADQLNKDQLTQLAQEIKSWGQALGFQKIGICDIDLKQHEQYLNHWLAASHHGEMAFMAAHGSKRSRPDELIPSTLRIISVRMDHFTDPNDPQEILDDKNKAYIARYALGRDYHKLMRKRLATLADRIGTYIKENVSTTEHNYRAFVDSAPVLERAIAEKAGLGWIGKNTMLIHEQLGSWFFLGEIYTNLPLPIDMDIQVNRCGSCNACAVACPTNAFIAPYQLDARRCISYLTIELKTAIPLEFRKAMGNRVFGCDDCQLACPFNKWRPQSNEMDFSPRHQLASSDLVALFRWNEATYLQNTQGSAIRRIGFERWLRNLAIGLGNAPTSDDIVNALRSRLDYPSELVREHVMWALEQHGWRLDL